MESYLADEQIPYHLSAGDVHGSPERIQIQRAEQRVGEAKG